MIASFPDGMRRLSCKKCGHQNLVPQRVTSQPPSEAGSYAFTPKASPVCGRCLKVLSYS
jgi:hypothetical protein